ncbi:MAG: mobile mystery protein B [Bdellovibrionota bacterium]
MVGRFIFKDRDGRTPLPEEWKKDLVSKQKHIKLGAELDEAEEENIVEGLVWLDDYAGDYVDALFWKKAHKKMFDKVWKWAGEFRQHKLMNDDFNHPGFIQENIKKLEGDLRYWLSVEAQMDPKECMARFHERLLTIHPFSNGNGRTTRILTEYICKRKDFEAPTWGKAIRGKAKAHRQTYIDAVVKARHKLDFSELIKFMYS